MRFLQNQGYRKDGKIDEKTMQKGGCQKVGKSMPKGISKVILDAERHRRTPWTLAVESKAIERNRQTSAALAKKQIKRTYQSHQQITKMAPEIAPETILETSI